MGIVGDRRFVDIPGDKVHQLPPLIVGSDHALGLEQVAAKARVIGQDMLPFGQLDDVGDLEGLAINLVEQYLAFRAEWKAGDDLLRWCKNCEQALNKTRGLEFLNRTIVWPATGQKRFLDLVADKGITSVIVGRRSVEDLKRALMFRIIFHQPPPISYLTDQFLLYLKNVGAKETYVHWQATNQAPSLPPERFTFQVVNMSLE